MHNYVNVMLFYLNAFLKIIQYGFDQKENLVFYVCQDCGFIWFYANMNYVHCIDGSDEEVEDIADIVMYLNF